MIQPVGYFIEKMITFLMTVTIINIPKLVYGYGDNLELLMAAQAQLNFLMKTYTVTAGSEAILL